MTMQEIAQSICTVGQAIDILKIKRSSIHSLIKNHTIPSIKLGDICLLSKQAVIDYATSPKRSYQKREESREFLESFVPSHLL